MENELILVNKMESTVRQAVEELFKEKEYESVCKCSRCKLDIIALSLNILPPKYTVTTKGNAVVSVKLSSDQWRADVSMAVYKAIKIVNNNPRHS